MSIGRMERVTKSGPEIIFDADASRRTKPEATIAKELLSRKIREVALDREIAAFDKKRQIAALIDDGLSERGSFIRTADGRGFFFCDGERRILDLEQTPFQHTLTSISGLSSTETFFSFALDTLQAKVSKSAPLAEIQTFAYFNPEDKFVAVSDGSGGMWIRERGATWREKRNGELGIFFLTEPEAEVFRPELGDPESFRWFLEQFLFSEVTAFPANDARVLLSVFLLQQFFPPFRQTRVIPAFIGPQGSGKTTAERLIGRWCFRQLDLAPFDRLIWPHPTG